MTIFHFLGAIILAGFAATITMFRKGGIYNPTEPTTTPEAPNLPPATSTPPSAPIEPSTVTSTHVYPTLGDFLKWQWQFEGAVTANNNPGNYRYFYGEYLPIYGNVKKSKGEFAMFPTLTQGQIYATNSTKNVIRHHPELTILTYLGGNEDWSGYAPASDNNDPSDYATFIATHLGVDIQFPMRSLIV